MCFKNRKLCAYWKKLYCGLLKKQKLYIINKIFQSHRCIINENVKILDDSLITPDTIIPPFSVYGGKPGELIAYEHNLYLFLIAIYIGELPETTFMIHKQDAINYYNSFVPQAVVKKK